MLNKFIIVYVVTSNDWCIKVSAWSCASQTFSGCVALQ